MISHSIAFLVLRKNLYVIFCHNNGLLTKYMVKVQSWKMASNLVRMAANPCRIEESLPAGCLFDLSTTITCSETSCLQQTASGVTLLEYFHFRLCHRQKRSWWRMDSLKTDMFESTLEGTDCEFCLQHPIFGFFFFVNKKKLFFSIDLCVVFRVCAV